MACNERRGWGLLLCRRTGPMQGNSIISGIWVIPTCLGHRLYSDYKRGKEDNSLVTALSCSDQASFLHTEHTSFNPWKHLKIGIKKIQIPRKFLFANHECIFISWKVLEGPPDNLFKTWPSPLPQSTQDSILPLSTQREGLSLCH